MSEAPPIDHLGRPPESLWEKIRAEPERAPEHIALAAAERFGPQAAHWVAVAGPGQTPEKLAHTAYRKHVRMSRLEGAALGLGGAVTAIPDLVALAWIQSRMVFFVAAAYGYDPYHPMRPAELLALQDFYETPAQARQALDGVGTHLALAAAQRTLTRGGEHTLRSKLLRYAAKRAARRAASRWIPLVGAPMGAVQNAAATKELGQRALAYYGGDQARP